MKNLPLTEILQTSIALVFSQLIFITAKNMTRQSGHQRFTVFYARLLSGLLFVLVPMTASSSVSDFLRYTQFTNLRITFICSLVFSVLVSIVTSRTASRLENLKSHPQLRIEQWNAASLFFNALTWTFYLASYEVLLRGYLLSKCLQSLPLAYAILVNVILYSLAHFPKGRREAIGAIPFGMLLCMLTYLTGNIWSAIVIHGSLALSNDLFSIRAGRRNYFPKETKLI